jgi:formylglycine-generating enzyme required for sulfatase activity
MRFVFVPGGTFRMGSSHREIFTNAQVLEAAKRGKAGEDYFGWEQPQSDVYVSGFFIGVHEVTNAEYRQFLDDWRAGRVPPECEFPIPTAPPDHVPFLWEHELAAEFHGDRQPAVGLSWLDGYAFCRWMGGRLPTEAEWEKAARGTDGRTWPWGNHFDAMRTNTAESSNRRSLEVGTFPGGRSPYGCFDMAGNAAEFCLDAYDETTYRFLPKKDPCLVHRTPLSDLRVQRGGNWNKNGLLHKARCAARAYNKIETRYPTPDKLQMEVVIPSDYMVCGFRVVLSPLLDVYPEGAIEKIRAQLVAEAARLKAAANAKKAGNGDPKRLPTGDEDDGAPRGDDRRRP